MPERIGIFGGSFDPIHLGHVGMALRAACELALDRVLVVPAHVSPFKTEGLPPMDDGARWRMVRLACEGRPPLEPCDIELRRGGVSYAIDTVRAVAAAHPGAELFFIVGEDAAEGLPQWREYGGLKRLCRFAVYPRTRESSTEIRRRLARGESADDMLDPRVAALLRGRACAGESGILSARGENSK